MLNLVYTYIKLIHLFLMLVFGLVAYFLFFFGVYFAKIFVTYNSLFLKNYLIQYLAKSFLQDYKISYMNEIQYLAKSFLQDYKISYMNEIQHY